MCFDWGVRANLKEKTALLIYFVFMLFFQRKRSGLFLWRQRGVEAARDATNPPPADYASTQAVKDAESGQLRLRASEERTVAGQEVDHNLFIVCQVIGVSKCLAIALHIKI
jgi:hypothetical protein